MTSATEQTPETAASSSGTDSDASATGASSRPLGVIRANMSPDQVVKTLDTAARRGLMPGFERASPPRLFCVAAFGSPFDGVLSARAETAGGASGGCLLRFEPTIKPTFPWVFAIILVLSIWPGVVLTESLLASFFSSTPWAWKYTWWWYMPLSILSSPWAMWAAWKKSRASVDESSHEALGKIAELLGAKVEAA